MSGSLSPAVIVVLLSLGAALAYGLSDFLGGVLARRMSAWTVAVVGSAVAAILTTGAAWVVPGSPRAVDLAWGALAGLGSGAGAGFLYRGMARGRMGVVAPVSAVGSALLPVVAGVLGGERPALLVWLGVALALPGIWLVSREPSSGDGRGGTVLADGFVDGVLAGLGFGLLFAALGQVPESAGWWPLALAQATGVVAVVGLAALMRSPWLPRSGTAWWAAGCGVLATAATALFLLATQRGFLVVAGVLTSLYPASTVLLAAGLLGERVHRSQGVGLALCAGAIALVAAG